MWRCPWSVVLALSFTALSSAQVAGDDDSGWRISPDKVNIQVGDDRPLQLLDDVAHELHGGEWSVNEPSLAEIQEEDGRVVLHAKAAGTVRVTAVLGLERRSREIEIWSPTQPLPPGTSGWKMRPIGRDIGDLAAVPTANGPDLFSLEQTATGSTYLRAVTNDGIQVWSWLMPEKTRAVELVCGDWMGGALISASHGSSFTLYTVGTDGKLRWQHTLDGIRKSHAYNLEHLIHVLSQSPDRTVTKVTGLDEVTGAQKFELTVPASHEKRLNVRKSGAKILCASQSGFSPVPTGTSRLFVNSDGLAYLAFTQQEWELGAAKCAPGSVLEAADVKQVRNQRLLLWQIHPDGTYRSTILEESRSSGPLSETLNVATPTGAIIPDGLGGLLVSVGWTHEAQKTDGRRPPDEFVYRLDESGKVVFQFPLPQYDGPLRDEMVLGQDERGFATRGGILIAFNVRDGREVWRWDSHTPDIAVFAALANGGCMLQTPTALVEVDNATDSKEIFKGKAMVNWQGQLFRKDN
jgi:outer membrane protein assembly factor BamB